MKKYLNRLVLFSFLALFAGTTSSCKTKEGCEAYNEYKKNEQDPQPLSTKRGKSNLFSKKSRSKLRT